MGSLFKRGNIWWIKYYQNGTTYRESSGSTKKMVAKKLLNRREGDAATGKMPSIQFEKVKFDELVEEFFTDYRINRRKSINRAELSVRHLLEEFKGARVPKITTVRVQDYISDRMRWQCKSCDMCFHVGGDLKCPRCGGDDLKKGASNATINRELAALRRILSLGAKQTPPKVDRVPYIPMLKEVNIRKGFFEHHEFIALRNALPSYLKPFVTFGYKVGWRSREIASLTWSHVDLRNGIVNLRVGETKNNEGRTAYLDDELRELFQTQWNARKRQGKLIPYVFPNRNGTGPIVDIKKVWNRACRETGLGYGYKDTRVYVRKWQDKYPAGPIFHDFRRTAVRNMIRSGVPERVAMMISGHKTRSVFDRYNIVSEDDLKAAARKQERYLESQVGTILGTVADFGAKKERKIEANLLK